MRKNAISFKDWCENNNRTDYLECWNYEKNGNVTPSDVSFGTHKKYYFKCLECETNYERAPHSFKVNGFNGCPKCHIKRRAKSRHDTATKKNNLLFFYPEIAEEWDSAKNGIEASDVSYNDNHVYWWKCNICGCEWKALPKNRVNGTGCPKCSSIYHTSFPERAVYFYVKRYFDDAVISDKHLGFELDIFIPSLSVGVEYDGEQWHQNIQKDEKKNIACEKEKVTLYRIRERKCWFWNETQYLKLIPTETGNTKELENAITVLLMELNVLFPEINIDKDKKEIIGEYLNAKKCNSLLLKYPEIAREWHPTKNLPLTPDKIDYGSGIKCYWVCSKCGYEYEATPNARTCKRTGCPSCAHLVAWFGHTDIQTLYPELMKEWNFEKNKKLGLDPSSILPNSMKKAYWVCDKGHEWQASIGNRIRKHYGCPQCAIESRYKKVINIETGMVFDSIKEASIFYNIPNGKIIECCKGKRKTAGRFHWKYF